MTTSIYVMGDRSTEVSHPASGVERIPTARRRGRDSGAGNRKYDSQ
jgi:hypothetical protein